MTDARPTPRTLTYQELQMVDVFVFLVMRREAGGTYVDIAGWLGRSATSPRLRALLDEMVERGFVTKRRAVWDRRKPWIFYAPEAAWQGRDNDDGT